MCHCLLRVHPCMSTYTCVLSDPINISVAQDSQSFTPVWVIMDDYLWYQLHKNVLQYELCVCVCVFQYELFFPLLSFLSHFLSESIPLWQQGDCSTATVSYWLTLIVGCKMLGMFPGCHAVCPVKWQNVSLRGGQLPSHSCDSFTLKLINVNNFQSAGMCDQKQM